jgi:uncharacterized membrane protein
MYGQKISTGRKIMAKRSDNIKEFLRPAEKEMVEKAVADAEKNTSAEIKVVILRYCWDDIKRKAMSLFCKYELHKTADRNCVMILLVTANREFLIYGDVGINEKTGQGFWDEERDLMARHFAADKFGEGIAAAVENTGKKLAEFFPYQPDDVNEISNEVGYEE